jgi:2-polyprenyl-3-methyl-5-hydroxy-6-metoxy-1,4-benzoquinol methylase
MDKRVVDKLLALNRQFYDQFAAQFSDTRGPSQPGLLQMAQYLPQSGSLLDVGCGNGRLAFLLDDQNRNLTYVGVDQNESLLAIARRQASALRHVRADFKQADVAAPGWTQTLASSSFDAITLLAVMHHLPADHLRRRVMSAIRPLLRPAGVVALSTWQFLNSQRLRRKIVPWSQVGLSPADVDPGDYLLDWRRGGIGLRYCHLINEAELRELACSTGFQLKSLFLADGRAGNLNLFAILVRTPEEY